MAKDLGYYMSLQYPVQIVSHETGGCFATHPLLEGCMAEGATADEAIANLADSRELWIETRLANGYPVPEPEAEELSGRISLRMAPSLHARLAELADQKKISLNLLINTVLAEYVGGAGLQAELQELLGELRASVFASDPLPKLRATS